MVYLYYFLLVVLVLILILTFFFYFLMIIGFIQSRGVPFVRLPKKLIKKCVPHFDLQPGQNFYDLGCGDGIIIFAVEKKYPNAKFKGFEICFSALLLAKFKKLLKHSKAEFYYQDFFKQDLAEADIVFCYLFPQVMGQLKAKLMNELKPGSKVFAMAFPFADWQAENVLEIDPNGWGNLYVYEIK